MDLQTVATIVSVLAMGAINLVVITWRAADLSAQVASLASRLARIEGHEESCFEQRTAMLERIARLEAAVHAKHPLRAGP